MILMEDGLGWTTTTTTGYGIVDLDDGDEGGDDIILDLDLLMNILSEPNNDTNNNNINQSNTFSQSSHEENPGVEMPVTDDRNGTNFDHQNGFQMSDGIHLDISNVDGCHSQDARVGDSFTSIYHTERSAAEIDSTGNQNDFQFQNGFQIPDGEHALNSQSTETSAFYGLDNLDARVGCSIASVDYAGTSDVALDNLKMDPSSQNSNHTNTHSGSFKEWVSPVTGDQGEESVGVMQYEIPSCSTAGSFAEGESNYITNNLELNILGDHGTWSTFYNDSDNNHESGSHHSAEPFDGTYLIESPECFLNGSLSFEFLPNNEIGAFQSESACSASEISVIDYFNDKGNNFKSEGVNSRSPSSGNFSSTADDRIADDKSVGLPFNRAVEEGALRRSSMWHSDGMSNGHVSSHFSRGDESSPFVKEELKQSSSMPSQKSSVFMEEKRDMKRSFMRSQLNGISGKLHSNASERYLPCSKEPDLIKFKNYMKQERDKWNQQKNLGHLTSVSRESTQSNLTGGRSYVDDDSDVCILEDISQPARSSLNYALGMSNTPLQHSSYGDSVQYIGVGSAKIKANDERFVYRAALQDLSQPKSEASPPEGVLAVPLLRHQRIALSWMVQKETSSLYCSGGILADDQGLGKTVSTIALILKERPPSVIVDPDIVKKEELETLNLDEDDDDVAVVSQIKKEPNISQVIPNQVPKKSVDTCGKTNGRPKAGTLVVCPTSVLRQWAEELHKKVTRKANLSVLVYHGSNRTKDPCELAKFDVVLTTYSIVSMEVPKQPLVDEDEEDKGNADNDDVASLGLPFGKKRKYPPSSGKKCQKKKKGLDSELMESSNARPLAKVAWFRVVLDEAQSIKNHRTQVARACWGLRAKRRWCLSGTPIQNAIDDLYSYFRFLRYDPYAVYNSFCSTIKIPIQKSPSKGYKKLQAVLKTIMLRRTKGTYIDGKPIINLPPKVVELKKVEFTDEERDFYTRLESDSRDQFREYEEAGTVKQNYVNILLMLLRLRQACDHPLLVRGIASNSFGKSSVEMAKKLPRERQIGLLNCLEASLAICGICNDPPEDAVVSTCGHVFCNQCICEHLTGDDLVCPTSKCKTRLNASLVFSKVTLNSLLSGQPSQEGSGSETGVEAQSTSEGLPYDSSKIRAALEVLKSLNKPKGCSSSDHSTCPATSSSSGISVNESTGTISIPVIENGNCSVKVAGEKAIVFSQWTRMLDLLEAFLKSSSVQYRRLDGTMSVVARDKAVKDFNTLPEVTVMIMSLKAASLGLNMVAACRVLLLDLWWNPTTEDQAIDRAHRIGQTRPVTVFRLTVKDTVEDRILALQQKKREMVASAFGEDETGSRQTRLTEEDLRYLFMA